VLLVVFIEYNLFDRKIQKVNEKIEDLTNKNDLLVKENADFQSQIKEIKSYLKNLVEDYESKDDENDYILRKLDYYIEKYRNLEAYIDDTVHEYTLCIEEKIEESIEESSRKLEKTHEDLSRMCVDRHACVLSKMERMKEDLKDNREKTDMLSSIIEVINENNREKTEIISGINDKLIEVSQEVVITGVSINEKIENMNEKIESITDDIKSMDDEIGSIIDEMDIDKSVLSGKPKPSGFCKPSLISNELADFLKKPHGTKMARTEVTKEINSYIINKGLKNKQNGRIIDPDATLTKLLNVKPTDELSYFNCQKFLKHHFINTTEKEDTLSIMVNDKLYLYKK